MIVIKDMEIPETCAECDLSRYDDGYCGGYGCGKAGYWCRRLKRFVPESERDKDCPMGYVGEITKEEWRRMRDNFFKRK